MLAHDLPCSGCGYNLRGLDPAGQCPECGRAVQVTVEAERWRFQPYLSRAEPINRQRWLEGLACVLVSSGLTMIVAVLLDTIVVVPHHALWVTVLAIAATAWVLNGLGVWQLARADPAIDAANGSSWKTKSLRAAIVLAVLLPGALGQGRVNRGPELGVLAVPVALAVPMAAVLVHLRLRRLALADGATSLARQCAALAIAMPLWSCGCLGTGGDLGSSSLDMLLVLPNSTCGSAAAPVIALGMLSRSGISVFWPIAFGLPLWELTVVALVLRRILRPAGSAENTAPSSRP